METFPSNPPKSMLVISIGFVLVYFLGLKSETQLYWALGVIFICGFSGLFLPKVSLRIEWLWMQLAKFLSHIIPPILLGMIFYLVLSPLALIQQFFGKQKSIQLKNASTSQWKLVDKVFQAEDLKNPW